MNNTIKHLKNGDFEVIPLNVPTSDKLSEGKCSEDSCGDHNDK